MSAANALTIGAMKQRCSEAEWRARVNLAACYRLVDMYGMPDITANHISARIPAEEGVYLSNAYGMKDEEIIL